MSKLLSIIIPIYNVEQYVLRCLESLYTPALDEDLFEVICINDGSSDSSLDILQDFSVNHKNICVKTQSNQGVSVARNEGLSLANGKYVTFIDPDDWVVSNGLIELISEFRSDEDIDLYYLRKSYSTNSHLDIWGKPISLDYGITYTSQQLYTHNFVHSPIWGCVYLLSFLRKNNILFPVGIRNAEDSCFSTISMALASSVKFLNLRFNVIYPRPNSASRDADPSRIKDYYEVVKLTESIPNLYKLDNNQCLYVNRLRYQLLSALLNHAALCNISNKEIRKLNLEKFLPIDTHKLYYQKHKAIALNSSISIFYNALRILRLIRKFITVFS